MAEAGAREVNPEVSYIIRSLDSRLGTMRCRNNLNINGITYPTVEHVLAMHKAALLGHQWLRLDNIRSMSGKDVNRMAIHELPTDPNTFDAWKHHLQTICPIIVRYLVDHAKHFADKLVNTEYRYIAYANELDPLLGTGLPHIQHIGIPARAHPGCNIWGIELMRLRDEMVTDEIAVYDDSDSSVDPIDPY